MYSVKANNKFTGHKQCPRCAAEGKDRGKNNLGTWSDGSQYCFSCKYYRAPSQTVDSLKERFEMSMEVSALTKKPVNVIHKTLTRSLPSHVRLYLASKYMAPQYRQDADIMYDEEQDYLVYPVKDKDGSLVFTNARYMGKDTNKPRYFSQGSTENHIKLLGNPNSPVLFIVEDYLSACRIGMTLDPEGFAYCAYPMFGASPRRNHMHLFTEMFASVLFFMDPDKHKEAEAFAKEWRPFFQYTNYLHVEKDPKDYPPADLKIILNAHYRQAMNKIDPSSVNDPTFTGPFNDHEDVT